MLLHVSSTCAHHQEVKIALHNLWYHHTYIGGRLVHETATYMCDDVEACKIVKQKFCASSWLITKINSKLTFP